MLGKSLEGDAKVAISKDIFTLTFHIESDKVFLEECLQLGRERMGEANMHNGQD